MRKKWNKAVERHDAKALRKLYKAGYNPPWVVKWASVPWPRPSKRRRVPLPRADAWDRALRLGKIDDMRLLLLSGFVPQWLLAKHYSALWPTLVVCCGGVCYNGAIRGDRSRYTRIMDGREAWDNYYKNKDVAGLRLMLDAGYLEG